MIFLPLSVFYNFPIVNVCSLGNTEVIEISKEKHMEHRPQSLRGKQSPPALDPGQGFPGEDHTATSAAIFKTMRPIPLASHLSCVTCSGASAGLSAHTEWSRPVPPVDGSHFGEWPCSLCPGKVLSGTFLFPSRASPISIHNGS